MKTELSTTTVDDRRRIVLPRSCPANVPVIIQELDSDTWLVKRARRDANVIMVAIERIDRLPDDPKWETLEKKMAAQNNQNLPAFDDEGV